MCISSCVTTATKSTYDGRTGTAWFSGWSTPTDWHDSGETTRWVHGAGLCCSSDHQMFVSGDMQALMCGPVSTEPRQYDIRENVPCIAALLQAQHHQKGAWSKTPLQVSVPLSNKWTVCLVHHNSMLSYHDLLLSGSHQVSETTTGHQETAASSCWVPRTHPTSRWGLLKQQSLTWVQWGQFWGFPWSCFSTDFSNRCPCEIEKHSINVPNAIKQDKSLQNRKQIVPYLSCGFSFREEQCVLGYIGCIVRDYFSFCCESNTNIKGQGILK